MYRLSLILQFENLYLELTNKINWLTGKRGNYICDIQYAIPDTRYEQQINIADF